MTGDLPAVREEYVKSLDLREDRGSDTAFSSSQYYNPAHLNLSLSFYLIFNNASVATARMIPISQKRATIFASGMARTGFWIMAGMPSFW